MAVSLKVRVQKFGAFLSGMVMPNIGAFIAWGILTALFIDTGWMPNEALNNLVGPTLTYLLPVLIGYTGGTAVHGRRGGVMGAIATMGVVIGADITMLVGGMVMGPLGAWVLKKFDKAVEGKVKAGMEMLVDNFSMGILGAAFMVLGFWGIEPIFNAILTVLAGGVNFLMNRGLLPLTAIFVQPGQVLFLNNAINHGIMGPLAVEQAAELGKSVLFLVEANCGNWFGVTLAFSLFGKGVAKRSAPAAGIIMFFGGIGEVVYPYVLSKPKTLLGPILGNIAALFILTTFGGGTVAAVSPGSFLALLAMTPRGSFFANISAYFVSCAISMAVVAFFLIRDKSPDDDMILAAAGPDLSELGISMPATMSSGSTSAINVRKIYVACDAGMGSSVMAVSIMKTKLNKAALDIAVDHVAIAQIPEDADVVVTTKSLEERTRHEVAQYSKDIPVFAVENLLNNADYDVVIDYLNGKTNAKV